MFILLNTNKKDYQIEVTLNIKSNDIYRQLKTSYFDFSYSDFFENYIMDTQILEAINYIRDKSKKKVTINEIVTYLSNAGASNWDKESAEASLKEMQTNSIINENYKPLITLSSDSGRKRRY